MSEQLVADAYQERKNRELDGLYAPITGAAPTTDPNAEGAPAPAQPTSSVKPTGGMSVGQEIISPWTDAGKQMADAIVPPPSSQVGVPRRLWEFTKGLGGALMAPGSSLGNLVGHVLEHGDDASGALSDATLDKKIADAKAIAALPGGGSSADVNALPLYERLRAMPEEERLKLMHDSASFAVSNVAAAAGLNLPIPGAGLVTQGLSKASRWIRSGAAAAEDVSAPAATVGEGMAADLGKAAATKTVSNVNPDAALAARDAAGAIEGAPEAPAGSSPNTGRMNVSDSAKALVTNINQQLQEAGDLTRATTQTHAQTIEMAQASPYRSVEAILAHDDNAPLAAHDLVAARDVRDAVVNHADTLAERVLAGDTSAGAEFRAAILTTGQVSAKVTNAQTAIGRASDAGNIISQASRAHALDMDRWAQGIEALGANLPASDEELAMTWRTLKATGQEAQLADQAAKRPSAFWSIYYGLNLLSSPATHIAKTSGEIASIATGLIERGTAAVIARPFRWLGREGQHVAPGELGDQVAGMWDHVGDAFKAFRNAYSGGKVFGPGGSLGEMNPSGAMDFVYGDLPKAPASTEVALDAPGGLMQKFFDVAGTKVVGGLQQTGQFFQHSMSGVADFWQTLAFHGEIRALARRAAFNEGLEGDALLARQAELMQSPKEWMLTQAETYAKERTFQKEFTNEYAVAAQKVAMSPVARLTVTPFWRTPVRLAEFGMDHTPILNEIASAVRGDFQAGGVRAEMALARSASSWAFTGAAYEMGVHGILTGAGPVDLKTREHMIESGWQEFSIYNPTTGKYYSYKPLMTVFPAIGIAASLAEMAPAMRDGDIGTMLTATSLAMVRGALDQPFWRGAADALDAITEYKDRGTGAAMERFVNNRLASLMPGAALGRTIVRDAPVGMGGTVTQPDAKPTGDNVGIWEEVQALRKTFMAQIPGFASQLPARRNMITGEPIIRGESALGVTPYAVTTQTSDPVLEEVFYKQQGAGLPLEPPRVLGGSQPTALGQLDPSDFKEGVRLTEKERSTLIDHLTQDKLGGKNLHDRLEQVINSAAYQKLSDGPSGGKALEIRKVYQGYLMSAEARTKDDYPELAQIVIQRRIARAQGLLAPSAQ
jgi:hypothetical protein